MLTSKQDEILLILQEECAEVIQAVSKIKRFGLMDNLDQLKMELADLQCMIDLVQDNNICQYEGDEFNNRIRLKREKLKRYSSIFKTDLSVN